MFWRNTHSIVNLRISSGRVMIESAHASSGDEYSRPHRASPSGHHRAGSDSAGEVELQGRGVVTTARVREGRHLAPRSVDTAGRGGRLMPLAPPRTATRRPAAPEIPTIYRRHRLRCLVADAWEMRRGDHRRARVPRQDELPKLGELDGQLRSFGRPNLYTPIFFLPVVAGSLMWVTRSLRPKMPPVRQEGYAGKKVKKLGDQLVNCSQKGHSCLTGRSRSCWTINAVYDHGRFSTGTSPDGRLCSQVRIAFHLFASSRSELNRVTRSRTLRDRRYPSHE